MKFLIFLSYVILIAIALITPAAADTMIRHDDTDLAGNDFTVIEILSQNPGDCAQACLDHADCIAATYVKPGTIQGPQAWCWLKKGTVPASSANSNTISWIRSSSSYFKCSLTQPHADFDFTPSPIHAPAPVDYFFTDRSTDAGSWSWDFGDGSPLAMVQNPGHEYLNPGTYTVTLTVTASCGTLTDTISKTFTVAGQTLMPGKLIVSSTPSGALISVDGVESGPTPATLVILSPGSHTLRLVRSGYLDNTTSVTIAEGQTKTVAITLFPIPATTGSLNISTTPSGASVMIDGAMKGMTPLMITGLNPGSHAFAITKSGYVDYTGAAVVVANTITPMSLALVPAAPLQTFGAINVTTNPAGATIVIDGIQKGTSPKFLANLTPGSHAAVLSLSGYQTWSGAVTVALGQTTPLTITLIKANLTAKPTDSGTLPSGFGSIVIHSSPEGANLYFDGERQGTTPVTIQNVKAGSHKVLLTLSNYNDTEQSVQVAQGTQHQVTIQLGKIQQSPGFEGILAILACCIIYRLRGGGSHEVSGGEQQ